MPGDAIIKGAPQAVFRKNYMSNPKYWPLDYEPEGEIYDNPAWDLPGFRRDPRGRRRLQRHRSAGDFGTVPGVS